MEKERGGSGIWARIGNASSIPKLWRRWEQRWSIRGICRYRGGFNAKPSLPNIVGLQSCTGQSVGNYRQVYGVGRDYASPYVLAKQFARAQSLDDKHTGLCSKPLRYPNRRCLCDAGLCSNGMRRAGSIFPYDRLNSSTIIGWVQALGSRLDHATNQAWAIGRRIRKRRQN